MKKVFLVLPLIMIFVASGCSSIERKDSSKETMKTTESGLKYIAIKEAEADARQAKAGDIVAVHYTGYLEENGQPGKKFDSSVDRGQPIAFQLGAGQVIKGWEEGIALMKVGEKGRLIIPSQLGYGPAGAHGIIPGNATLIFDVELVGIR